MNPLFLATNAAVAAANYPAARFARVSFLGSLEALPRTAVLIAWHRFNYALAGAFLRAAPEHRPTLVMHDGVASVALSHKSSEWMGMQRFVFRRRATTSPREQIAAYVRESRRPILLLPDAGGPYGIVKPGVIAIARACGVPVVPLRMQCERALVVGRTLRHVIPLPWSKLYVELGDPIEPSNVTVDTCQAALGAW